MQKRDVCVMLGVMMMMMEIAETDREHMRMIRW